MAELVNLTPHALVFYNTEGTEVILTVPASGTQARVAVSQETVGELEGIPVVRSVFGAVTGLPEPVEGTTYVVSLMVLQALAGARKDLVGPDTGSTAVRDAGGKILGVRRFQVL